MTQADARFAQKRRLMSLRQWGETYGGSRSTAYRLAAAGKLRLVKRGARTLVDVDSADAHAASLPEWAPAAPKAAP